MKDVRMVILLSLLMLGVISIVIAWGYLRITTAYDGNVTDALPELALYIASAAAILTGLGLILTNKSLELTRATTRPFLNVIEPTRYGTYYSTVGMVAARIANKGVFPADNISVSCVIFHNGLS